MCDELRKEYEKFASLLTDKDLDYYNDAQIYHIKKPVPGYNFYKWKQTDNAIFYKKHNNINVITNMDYTFKTIPDYKVLKIYGLYELNERCRQEKQNIKS